MIRKTLMVLLVVAVAALVAGCGGGSQQGGRGSQESEPEQGQAGGASEGGGETTAAMEGELSQVARFQEPVFGTSFVSSLAEFFGGFRSESGRSWRGTRS